MNIWQLLIFKGSRKVGFALWLFLSSNTYLVMKLISAEQWFACVGLVSILIGGGTLGDAYLKVKTNKQLPEPPKNDTNIQ